VESLTSKINYGRAGELMEDGMNTYLNGLKSKGLWNQDAVRFILKDRGFDVFVGNGRWDAKLGGTLTIYFLISYHYSLLNLTRQEQCHYPGLLIMDFPAKVEDTTTQSNVERLTDNERFVMEPFKDLLSQTDMEAAQIIVAGSSFAGLEDVNRIELEGSWK
jgi:hypothetical protein